MLPAYLTIGFGPNSRLEFEDPEDDGVLAGDSEDRGLTIYDPVEISVDTELGGEHGVAVKGHEVGGARLQGCSLRGWGQLGDNEVGSEVLAGNLLGHRDPDD